MKSHMLRTALLSVFALSLWILKTPVLAQPFLDSALKDGTGIRALGMGGAFTGASTDGNAIFYNPAGMAEQATRYERGYLDLKSQNLTAGDYTYVTFPSLGFGDTRVADTSGNVVQIFTTAFGTRGKNRVAWGFSHKAVTGVVGGVPVAGYSFDAGLHGLFMPNLAYGVILQDIFRENVPVSTSARLGLAYRHAPSVGLFTTDLEIRDFKSPAGAKLFMHYGLESEISDNLTVRLGWGRESYTAGVTARFKWMTVIYALATDATVPTVHRFAFQLGQ